MRREIHALRCSQAPISTRISRTPHQIYRNQTRNDTAREHDGNKKRGAGRGRGAYSWQAVRRKAATKSTLPTKDTNPISAAAAARRPGGMGEAVRAGGAAARWVLACGALSESGDGDGRGLVRGEPHAVLITTQLFLWKKIITKPPSGNARQNYPRIRVLTPTPVNKI